MQTYLWGDFFLPLGRFFPRGDIFRGEIFSGQIFSGGIFTEYLHMTAQGTLTYLSPLTVSLCARNVDVAGRIGSEFSCGTGADVRSQTETVPFWLPDIR